MKDTHRVSYGERGKFPGSLQALLSLGLHLITTPEALQTQSFCFVFKEASFHEHH